WPSSSRICSVPDDWWGRAPSSGGDARNGAQIERGAQRLTRRRSRLVVLFGQVGQRQELDTILGQPDDLITRRLAIDTARLNLFKMDLARLFGKLVADIVGLAGNLVPIGPQQFADLGRVRMPCTDGHLVPGRAGQGWGHQRLLNRPVATHHTGDEASALLVIKRRSVAEPGVELVAV